MPAAVRPDDAERGEDWLAPVCLYGRLTGWADPAPPLPVPVSFFKPPRQGRDPVRILAGSDALEASETAHGIVYPIGLSDVLKCIVSDGCLKGLIIRLF
jgi:hypothetical protein